MKKHAGIIGLIIVLLMVGQSFAANIALNKPATASTWIEGFAIGDAVDGDFMTGWNAGRSATIAQPEWLKVDLENIYDVTSITLKGVQHYDQWAGRYEDYNLYISLDNQDWSKIGNGRLIGYNDPIDTYQFSQGMEMRYIKFEVVGGTLWSHLYEMEVVPEPATLSLLALGGLMIRRRCSRFKV
jgi:hypothetical protein